MNFKVTYLLNNEIAKYLPSSTEAHGIDIVEADGRYQAVEKFHKRMNGSLDSNRNRTPIIWSIEKIKKV